MARSAALAPHTSTMVANQQAGITIGIEPVAAFDRVGIGLLHGVETAESRYQHEQRRTRQVEIGQENIDRAETIAWSDEDRGVTSERFGRSCFRRSPFQQPQPSAAAR